MARYYIQKKPKGFEVTDNTGKTLSKKLFKTDGDARKFIEELKTPKKPEKEKENGTK